MKNIKKALVLVLAFAMIFGMFTIGASATTSFNDDADIVNKEAVSTLVELGIVNGEDGSFVPNRVVSRAEMCKMIAVALNGGVDVILDTGDAIFSDTKNHWARRYINYCFSKGIVSGDSGKGGVFRPDASVTALEAAKMMLVALGYNPTVAGFVGADWAQNVAMAANEKGLFDGIGDLNVTAGMIRDNAAQLVFNGLFAGMVKYENVLTTDANGNLVSSPRMVEDTMTVGGNTEVKTILTDKFKVKFDYGYLTNVGKETVAVYIDNTLGSSTSTNNTTVTYTKVASDYTGLLGQAVRVMYKSQDKVLGVVALDQNKAVETNANAVTYVSGDKVKFGGTEYTLESSINVFVIGTNGAITPDTANASNIASKATSFDKIKFVDNDGDNKYEYAVITRVAPAKVTYASSTEIIAGNTTYKYSAHTIADGIAKNDYVAVVGNPFKANSTITKATLQSGKITGYKSATFEYQIDNGTWYKAASALSGINPGDNMEFVAVNGFIYFAEKVGTTTTLSGVVLVLAKDPSGNLNRSVKILNADGTKSVVALDMTSTGAVDPTVGQLYTYTVTDYGYKFKGATDIGDYDYTTASTVANVNSKIATINGIEIADDAIIFVFDGANDGKVITGKHLKNLAAGTDVTATSIAEYTGVTNGLNRVTMAALTAVGGNLPTVGGDANKYALIVESSYQVDTDYITYKIWNGTSVETVKEKNITTRAAKTLIAYSTITDGVIKDVAVQTPTKAYVQAVVGDYVYLNGDTDASHKFKLTDKTVYFYYDSSATAANDIGKASGSLVAADKVVAGGTTIYTENVKYIASSGEIKVILVDVKNNLSDGTTYNITSVPAGSAVTVRTNLSVYATASATAQAGDVVTVTVTGTGTALSSAQEVKVRFGTQSAIVTLPALAAGATSSSATVTFVQPASAVTIQLPIERTITAPVDDAEYEYAVSATTAYEGDTVTIFITQIADNTGNEVITFVPTNATYAAGGKTTNVYEFDTVTTAPWATGSITYTVGAGNVSFTTTLTSK